MFWLIKFFFGGGEVLKCLQSTNFWIVVIHLLNNTNIKNFYYLFILFVVCRNYHVFYYLLAGADGQERDALHLCKPEEYYYLRQVPPWGSCSKKIHWHIFWSIPSFNVVFNSIITHMLLRWILVTDTGKTNKKDGLVAHYFKCILRMKVEMEYIIEYLLKYCTKLIFPVGYFCQIIVVKKFQ